MQTAANISLVLTNCSSLQRLADSKKEISYGGFYQQVASELVKSVYTRQVWRYLGDKLVVLAEQSHAFRQMDALEKVSQILMNSPVPLQYKEVGQYYQALCIQRFGRGDLDRAAQMIVPVAEHGPSRYRARALISLGANSIDRGDNQSALSYYCEAGRLASRSCFCDPYATLHTQKMVSYIKSDDGNHRNALALLENLFPLAHSMRSSLPHVYYDYMNSLAVELCEVGRLEEAANASRVALASPFASAYPEWRETSKEIALRGRRPSRATVAFSQNISEAKDLRPIPRQCSADDLAASQGIPEAKNLVRLPVPEHGDSLTEPPPVSEPAAVLDMQEWKKKMTKRSNSDPQDRIPRPTTEKDKQARLMELRKLGTRERLVRLMTLAGDEEITDDELLRALIILEGLEPDEKQGS